MKGKKTLLMIMLIWLCGAGTAAHAQQSTAGEQTYTYYYNSFDWHMSAQYVKLNFENPTRSEYADIGMFILNTYLVDDIYAKTAKQVVAGDPGLAVAYCCDAQTGISYRQPNNQYRRINLEDADYYDEKAAAKVRAIVRSGYQHSWTDADLGAAEQKANAWLRAKGMETISSLTHAQALTATQLAIWLNANCENLVSATYYGLQDYSVYDRTTYDPVKVPSGMPSNQQERERLNAANAKNVELFKQYLLSLEGVPPKTVIFTEDHFVADSAMYAEDPGLHDVTLRFTLDGTVSLQDSLTLTVRLGDIEKQYRLGKDATLTCDSLGYYAVSFDQVDAKALARGVEVTVSGTQMLADDAYFYEPREVAGEDPRDVSQNLVGYQPAGTQTLVFAACTIEVDPDEIIVLEKKTIPETGDRGAAPWVTVLCLAAFFAGKQRLS